uniref:Ig-like domain-containing protein n=1 Tax=Cyprinus carpio carpio TaxID=630221 RepID=A0A8C1FLU7_CYPCA
MKSSAETPSQLMLLIILLTDIPKPTLTVLPQSSLFTGDSVTLRCEVDQSWDGGEFLWSKNSNTESTEAATKTIDSVKVSDGGEYRCRAGRGGYYTHYKSHLQFPLRASCALAITGLLFTRRNLASAKTERVSEMKRSCSFASE